MDTCNIRRCRWPLLAFINTQVCFKKWELWVSSVFVSSGCCNFQPLKACQKTVKINTQHWTTTRDFRAHLNSSHQCLHGLTSHQVQVPSHQVPVNNQVCMWGLVWSDGQIWHHAGTVMRNHPWKTQPHLSWAGKIKDKYCNQDTSSMLKHTLQMIHQSLDQSNSFKATIHGWH